MFEPWDGRGRPRGFPAPWESAESSRIKPEESEDRGFCGLGEAGRGEIPGGSRPQDSEFLGVDTGAWRLWARLTGGLGLSLIHI